MPKTIASVLLDQGLETPLDYLADGDITVGARVEVPLKNRSALGTVLKLKDSSPFQSIKPLIRTLSSKPIVSEDLFKLAIWVSKYYCAPLNKAIRAILPPMIRKQSAGPKTQWFVKSRLPLPKLKELCVELRKTRPAQAKVLELLLKTPKGLFLTEILQQAKVSKSPIETLKKNQVVNLQEVRIDRSAIFDHDFFPTKPKTLTSEQKKTLESLLSSLGSFKTHLIHGVTGSGKTEVYLQAIDKTLKQGKQVIYLVPEIALTPQTIERFKARFGARDIAIVHSKLSDGERFDIWYKIREGKAPIIIGARSAVFAPAPNLGLIIVDEEHESSYKQTDESPKYHARNVAIVRGQFAKCPVALGSATPSLESYTNAKLGKYALHTLTKRATKAHLPHVELIDMKREYETASGYTIFASPLIDKIKERLSKGEQTLLFLNRRGYQTHAECPACSHVVSCPHCEISLTYHRGESILACHLCDYTVPQPRSCPSCKSDNPLKYKGVGTERIERSLHALFPQARTLRLDADTTKHKGSHEKILKQFKSGKADILIGTQMIAKGLHFPLVTLVGVIAVDGSLNIPDFRASENVFQLLTQVAGRSGRGSLKGEVIVQTHIPGNPLLLHAKEQDYLSFYEEEIGIREMFAFPPFTQLVKCSFSGGDQHKVQREALSFRKSLIERLPKSAEILPVVPCGYAKIGGRYRYQCLIKTPKGAPVQAHLELLRLEFKKKGDIRLSIDVDPLTTFF